MLSPSERRLLSLLVLWLVAGIVLDVLALRAPRLVVPLVGASRLEDVRAAGRAEPEDGPPGRPRPDPTAAGAGAPARATSARGKGQTRGRPQVYDALGRLDLNAADSTELELVRGIGPSLAGRILAERARRGRFERLEDLLSVRGIGPRTLAKLLPGLTIRPHGSPGRDSLAGRRSSPKDSAQIAR